MKYAAVPAIAFSALVAFSGAALADNPPFTADKNQPDEGMNMHMDGEMMAHFEYLDVNGDGNLTEAEVAAHDKMHHELKEKIKQRGGKI
jgi:hypothetical protein|tara:strand:- start:244 stop:510 length:267 start_codon:yes stop_codon:yes gene_type:complete